MIEVTVGKMITPLDKKVLIELITESAEYVPGISRLNPFIEPYQRVTSVGENVKSVKPGDLILTRSMQYEAFKLYDSEYSLIYESDIAARITPEVAEEIKRKSGQQKSATNMGDIN